MQVEEEDVLEVLGRKEWKWINWEVSVRRKQGERKVI